VLYDIYTSRWSFTELESMDSQYNRALEYDYEAFFAILTKSETALIRIRLWGTVCNNDNHRLEEVAFSKFLQHSPFA
jgi:hypothetical protein